MPARDALAKQIQRFLDHLTVERGLSGHTVAAYRRDLERYAGFVRTRGITDARRVDERAVAGHVAAVSASTYGDGKTYRATSVVRALSSVRAFHRFLLRDGEISSDPTAGVIRPKLPRSLPKPLSVDDVARVLAHPDRSAKGLRDRAVLETLYGALHVDLRVQPAQRPQLHPGKAARFDAGWLGELHPLLLEGEWGAFELDLAALFSAVPERLVYDDVITFPALHQDLAFVVEENVLAGDLIAAAREAAGAELREMRVFDVYRGGQIPEGKKSIAFSVAFQSPEQTLSDEDARALRERVVAALAERFGAELRA